jgi:hypothetical protein
MSEKVERKKYTFRSPKETHSSEYKAKKYKIFSAKENQSDTNIA